MGSKGAVSERLAGLSVSRLGGYSAMCRREGLTQAQLCQLFQRDVSVVSRHIKNIFTEGELEKESNLHFLQIANSDRPVALYSLDVIISIGYRVKSVIGTRFRQWANKVLKEYILRGYAVNERLDVWSEKFSSMMSR